MSNMPTIGMMARVSITIETITSTKEYPPASPLRSLADNADPRGRRVDLDLAVRGSVGRANPKGGRRAGDGPIGLEREGGARADDYPVRKGTRLERGRVAHLVRRVAVEH